MVSDEATKTEAARQRELAISDMVEEQKRISFVSSTLSTKANALCGDEVQPSIGAYIMSKPKGEIGDVYTQQYGVGDEPTVLFMMKGSPAEVAGLHLRDVIKRVNGVAASDTKAITRLFETVDPEAPLIYEIDRSGAAISISIKPERACGYPVLLDPQQIVNAFADGKRVLIARGMVNFAKDDNELALVISHEMAHNLMKHIEAKKQNAIIGLLADLAIAIATKGQVNNSNLAQVGANAYSQEFEAEADYVGLYIMANAGFPITDAPKFWRRMAVANPANIKTNHSASHPSTAYRMVALEETVKEINTKIDKGEALVPNMKDGRFKPPSK